MIVLQYLAIEQLTSRAYRASCRSTDIVEDSFRTTVYVRGPTLSCLCYIIPTNIFHTYESLFILLRQ